VQNELAWDGEAAATYRLEETAIEDMLHIVNRQPKRCRIETRHAAGQMHRSHRPKLLPRK